MLASIVPFEDGFLCDPTHPHVGEVSPQRFVFLPLPGLASSAQYFRFNAGVEHDAPTAEYFILNGAAGEDSRIAATDAVRHLAIAFPSAMHTVMLESRTGWARARASVQSTPVQTELAAACVAAVLAGASWDESDPILVEMVDTLFAVSLVRVEGLWRATVRVT